MKNPWLVVSVREIMVKLTDKSFMLSTALTLVMILAGVGLSAYMGNRSTDHTVAVVGAEGTAVVAAAESVVEEGDDTLEATEFPNADAARDAVRAEEVDAALLPGDDGWTLVGLDEVSTTLSRALTDGVSAVVLERNAAAGTTVAELTAGAEVTTEVINGEERGQLVDAVGFVFAFLF
ncbi:hypothetical protein [Georgenia sp. AZ-5]|uniref:hypothetical protein n=1 Tax=Georgenia sp. AZ-5 TaxID=3367526 RepID=UPI003754AF4B